MRLQPGRFVGKTTSANLAGAVLSEVVHLGKRALPVHSHEWPYVSLLVSGAYRETVARRTIVFAPFNAVFHDRGLVHGDEIGEGGARFFVLEFGPAWRAALEASGPIADYVYELHGEGASWPMLRLFQHFTLGDLTHEIVEDALFEVCGHLPNAPLLGNAEPAWLRGIEAWLEQHFREPYSLERVARENHVNASHLARTFMRFRQKTIGDFVGRLRVQEACRRLNARGQTIEEVAFASGFTDQSHMTRVIRQLTGRTPAVLRASLH